MTKPAIGRPKLPPGEARITMTVRVKQKTMAEAKRRAAKARKSLGGVVDDAFGC